MVHRLSILLSGFVLLVACGATPAAVAPSGTPVPAEPTSALGAEAPTSAPAPAPSAVPTAAPAATREGAGARMSAGGAETGPVTISDATGNAVEIADTSRIVTVGGTVTEIVFALGAGEQVIGVDTSSTYPPEATALPKVGYQRQLAAEGVLALEPSLILTSSEAGPPEAIEQLQNAGVPVLVVPLEYSVDGAKQAIQMLAQALDRVEQGEELIAQLDRDLAEAAEVAATLDPAPRVLFLYARGANTVNAAGTGTSADEIIRLAGGQNAISEFEGFRPLTAEAAAAAAPDVLLLFETGLESLGGIEGLLQVPGIAQTPAGANGRVIAMDGLYLTGFGPRLGAAARDLATALQATQEGP